MNTWHFFDKTTGVISGASFSGSPEDLAAQLEHKGESVGAVEGVVDYQRQRVDGLNLDLVDCQPPRPPDTPWLTFSLDAAARNWIGAPTPRALAYAARALRSQLLAACDWTQTGDSPLAPDVKTAWQAYRAALRNLPEQPGFPAIIVWPEPPAEPSGAQALI